MLEDLKELGDHIKKYEGKLRNVFEDSLSLDAERASIIFVRFNKISDEKVKIDGIHAKEFTGEISEDPSLQGFAYTTCPKIELFRKAFYKEASSRWKKKLSMEAQSLGCSIRHLKCTFKLKNLNYC